MNPSLPNKGAATSGVQRARSWIVRAGLRMDYDIALVLKKLLEGTGQLLNGVPPWAIDPVLAERLLAIE